MKRNLTAVALGLLSSALLAAGIYTASAGKLIGGGCDGCELIFEDLPQSFAWETSIVDTSGGEPLEITGVIYQPDGKTPAADVLLYVYHTDAKGAYSPGPEQTRGRRHGQHRGWIKTARDGHYRFRTIRPAPYPGRNVPAHIHPIVKEPGKNEYYIDDYRFEGDPFLTQAIRDGRENRGGDGVIQLSKNAAGLWVGTRDIVLGRNIPDYR